MTAIPVARIAEHYDPFGLGGPWDVSVRRWDVAKALAGNHLLPVPVPDTIEGSNSRQAHAARIAFLVLHGWIDAIEIDVRCPSLSPAFWLNWIVLDGNHRLAAALYRGDELIEADVAGDLDGAFELFGVDCCNGIPA